MNCLETKKYLSAFLDNELDTRTNVDVVEHLRMCDHCAGRLEELGGLRGALSSYMKSVKAPQSLRDRITENLLDPAAHRRRVRAALRDFTANGWFRALTAAASILVVFTVVYVVLLRPPAVLASGAISKHLAVLRDQVPTWLYTTDAEKAKRRALIKMAHKPALPLIENSGFQLVGAGPCEIELRNVGHFVFRYKNEAVSMFVIEGMTADEFGGSDMQTPLGTAKVDSRRGANLVAWNAGNFTYVLVSRIPAGELLDKIAPSLLTQ